MGRSVRPKAQFSHQVTRPTPLRCARSRALVGALLRRGVAELQVEHGARAVLHAYAAGAASTSSRMRSRVVRMPLRFTLPRDHPHAAQ